MNRQYVKYALCIVRSGHIEMRARDYLQHVGYNLLSADCHGSRSVRFEIINNGYYEGFFILVCDVVKVPTFRSNLLPFCLLNMEAEGSS
jgi:hypothetical protein